MIFSISYQNLTTNYFNSKLAFNLKLKTNLESKMVYN